jgi:hypothetical protein
MGKSANLYVLLGFDPKNFNSGVKSAKDNVKGLSTDVKSTLNGIDNAVKGLGSSNAQFERLVTNASDAEQNIGTMKRQLKELSKMDFSKLSDVEIAGVKKRMAELTDGIGDAQTAIKQMSLDPFQKMASSIKTVSTLAEGVTGTMSLFGANTDTVNQYMQKTVALMGIANAAQEASVFFNETALGLTIKQRAAHLANIPAIAAVNATLAANPYAVILTAVIGIGTAIALWENNAMKTQMRLDATARTMTLIDNMLGGLTKAQALEVQLAEARGASEEQIYQLKRKHLIANRELQQMQVEATRDALKQKNLTAEQSIELQRQMVSQKQTVANANTSLKILEATNKTRKNTESFKAQQKAQEETTKAFLESDKGKIKAIEIGYSKELKALNNQLKYKYLNEQQYSEKLTELRQKTNEELSKLDGKSNLRMTFQPPEIESEDINIKPFDLSNYLENDTKKADEIIEGLNSSIQKIDVRPFDLVGIELNEVKGGLEATSQAFGSLGDAIGGNAGDWLSWGAQTMSTIAQMIPQVAALLGIQLAQGAAAQASLPFPYNLAAMAATAAGAISIITSIPKFASGGIVPGTSFSGDKVPALVNSGEMILNSGQQANLFRMINGGGVNGSGSVSGGEVEFKIKGETLVGVLKNTSNRNSKIR